MWVDSLPPVQDLFTADDARRWALFTRAALAARRREIDALNVFPVPDGDTGTNLYLTLDGALGQVVDIHEQAGILGTATLVQECETLSRAILLAARGNSGVILSQIVRGLCQVVIDGAYAALDPQALASCFERGARLARSAVAQPREGTMLTVADAAAAAAREAADGGVGLAALIAATTTAAQEALARTPTQLAELARAGVVDAGGAGVVLLLEAMHRVLTGAWTSETLGVVSGGGDGLPRRREWHPAAVSAAADDAAPDTAARAWADPADEAGPQGGVSGPAYEVMFLLGESDDTRVAALTAALADLGDSLIVVGGPDVWNVHVHVDDVGAAIEAGIEAGRPHRIRVTNFAEQLSAQTNRTPLGVVACAAGPGLARVLTDAGAVAVPSAPGARASAGQLLAAARRTGAQAVLVLPNDKDTVLAAEAAAREAAHHGLALHVVPARTAVQGLAALAVHDPHASIQDAVVAMTAAARATRHGAVTVAVKEALTWGGHCHPGDSLGIIDGDVVLVGGPLTEVATEVLARLLGGGGELVTLVSGADSPPDLLPGVLTWLRHDFPQVEVGVIDGGQQTYALLIGVE